MKKIVFYMLILWFSSSLFCEDLFFVESQELNPDINNLKNMDSNTANRRLFFVEEDGVFYSWNPSDNTINHVGVEIHPHSFTDDKFWNPHTEDSYILMHDPDGLHNGLHKLAFTDDHELVLELQDYHYTEPPFEIHKNRTFKSEYTGTSPTEATISYSITTEDGDVIWNRVYDYPANHVSYISDEWLLIEERGIDSVLNYETGEEISFNPEVIIGYGKGLILTSSSENQKEFTGITVWTPEKEILYRDKIFPLSEIIIDEDSWLFPRITSARFDYPYIYCNISLVWGSMHPLHRVIVMNLETGKTYLAPEGSRALAVFDEE